jgi:hypothetical protein
MVWAIVSAASRVRFWWQLGQRQLWWQAAGLRRGMRRSLVSVFAVGKLFTKLLGAARIASHIVFNLFVLCLLGCLECASDSYLFFFVLAAWC